MNENRRTFGVDNYMPWNVPLSWLVRGLCLSSGRRLFLSLFHPSLFYSTWIFALFQYFLLSISSIIVLCCVLCIYTFLPLIKCSVCVGFGQQFLRWHFAVAVIHLSMAIFLMENIHKERNERRKKSRHEWHNRECVMIKVQRQPLRNHKNVKIINQFLFSLSHAQWK